MTRRMPFYLTLAAAAAAVMLVLGWLFPGSALKVMGASGRQTGFRALEVGSDGQYYSRYLAGERDIIQELERRLCVRVPWSSGMDGLTAGDICFFSGGICAVVTPQGTYLYSSRDSAGYAVLGAGAAFYQEVSGALTSHTSGEGARL